MRYFETAANECTYDETICSAYLGTCKAMRANYASGMFEKLSLFNEGKSLIEKSVATNPLNPEIRFLRYCIQANVPSILFYSSEMEEDFEVIKSNYSISSEDDEFWLKAFQVMIDSERCSDAQKNWLSSKRKEITHGRSNTR